MVKILFIPFSIGGGLLAGFVAKKVFEGLWSVVDDQEPPESEHRRTSWGKLIAAAALEGAIFKATRVAADHGSRHAFANVTGTWPGDEEPDQNETSRAERKDRDMARDDHFDGGSGTGSGSGVGHTGHGDRQREGHDEQR